MASPLLSSYFLFTKACYFLLLQPFFCFSRQLDLHWISRENKQGKIALYRCLFLTFLLIEKNQGSFLCIFLQDRKPCPSVFTGTLFRCFVVNVDSFDNIMAILPQGLMMLTLYMFLTDICACQVLYIQDAIKAFIHTYMQTYIQDWSLDYLLR